MLYDLVIWPHLLEMRVPRVYIPQALGGQEEIVLPRSAHAHLVRVLRLRVGAALVLFDGLGGEYRGTLSRCDRREARVRVAGHVSVERESSLAVTLLQAVSRGDRMDHALQKATELGAARIVCVFCERTVSRLDGDRLNRRRAHWQGIIAAACEQSGRNRLPELAIRTCLGEALDSEDFPVPRMVLDPDAREGLGTMDRRVDQATLLVGPEGGLTTDEKAGVMTEKFLPVRFGPRILRTETAGLAALAALQVLWGDLK